MYIATLVEQMKTYPFGLLVDGSNDTGVEKLNPLTVRVLDVKRMEVTTQLLDMCALRQVAIVDQLTPYSAKLIL